DAAVGDQHEIAEARAVGGGGDRERDAAEVGQALLVLAAEGQRHQARAGGQHRVAEPARQLVAEAAGAHARDRKAAAGHHQRRRAELAARGVQAEIAGVAVDHALDRAGRLDPHPGRGAFVQQHAHDQLRGFVAEQLAQLLLVVRDAVAFDQLDEVPRGVARQRGLAEVRVGREVVCRAGTGVGEIAAPAAGHQDLLADLVGVLDHDRAQAAAAGGDGAHEPGGTAADDEDIAIVHRGRRAGQGGEGMLPSAPIASGKGMDRTVGGNATRSEEGLVRGIGRASLVALFINSVVGAGIFGLPSQVHAMLGPYALAAYLACALLVLLVVLCFAEVGSRFERTGGPYLYAHEAFGPVVGFQVGWLVWLTRVTAFAALCNLLLQYLAHFWPAATSPGWRLGLVLAVTATIVWVSIRGVRPAAIVANVFTIGKLVPLVLFVLVGLWFVEPARLAPQETPSLLDFSAGMLLLVFAFTGFETATVPAGEVREPRRSLPFAILVALAVIVPVYV